MQQKRKTAERTRNQQLNDGNVGSQYNIELCINEQNLRAIMCVFLLLNSCSVVAVVQLGDRNSFSSHIHTHTHMPSVRIGKKSSTTNAIFGQYSKQML